MKENDWSVLAGLRFLLAMIVLCFHVHSHFLAGTHGHNPITWAASFGGNSAVYAFLLLSGLSISHSLSKSTKDFYSRRADRIIPVFLACFSIACVPYLIWGPGFSIDGSKPPTFPQAIGDIFLLNNLLVDRLPTLGTAWSLSLECCCYAAAPLFVRMRTRYLFILMAGSVTLFVNQGRFVTLPDSNHGLALASLLWLWLAGFLFYRHRDNQRAAGALIFGGATVLALTPIPYCGSLFVFVLTCCAMIYSIQLSQPIAKIFNFLGDLSYPLYLVHYPVMCLFWGVNYNKPYLVIAASLLAGLVVLFGVDYPFRAYRRRQSNAYVKDAISAEVNTLPQIAA